MTPTRYDLRAWGRLIKTIFKKFPNIYTHFGTNLYYIPIVISKSAHPTVHCVQYAHCRIPGILCTNLRRGSFVCDRDSNRSQVLAHRIPMVSCVQTSGKSRFLFAILWIVGDLKNKGVPNAKSISIFLLLQN
jgi:hypothetical protein